MCSRYSAIAALALICSSALAACGKSDGETRQSAPPEAPPAASEPVPAPKPQPKPVEKTLPVEKEESESPDVLEYGEYEGGFHGWSGGMVWSDLSRQNNSTDKSFPIKFWLPGLDGIKECRLKPWLSGEEFTKVNAFDSRQADIIDLMATTGEKPKIGIVYDVRVLGSGLEANKARTFFQTMDPETCALGKRVDLGVETEGADAAVFVEFTGAGDKLLAIQADMVVIGVDPEKEEVVWRHEGSEHAKEIDAAVAGDGIVGIEYSAWKPDHFDLRVEFLNVDDGSVIYTGNNDPNNAIPRPADESYSLGKRSVPTTTGTDVGFMNDGKIIPLKFEQGYITPKASGRVGADTWINYGIFHWYGFDSSLVRFDLDGSYQEVISKEKWKALNLEIVGASGKYLYVRTSTEIVELGSDGKETGRKWSNDTPGLLKQTDGDRYIAGEVWTLWHSHVYGDEIFVTRAGIVPWDRTSKP